jgi:hypothetical protein
VSEPEKKSPPPPASEQPGACAVVFGYLGLQEKNWPAELTAWVVAGLAVGAGGILLIITAWRR